jgi:superfamily II DNA/RNA helicase
MPGRFTEDEFRILVATEVLSEGVNLHRSNIVFNYDIPWNPTRLIQRVGRVNRVDTKFDTIHTYNFFPTEESNDLIKLKEAAEAKIHAFIEMLGADARLLTEGEEIKSHDLFAKLTSKKTITGEDEEEESELEYLTEIRNVRDENADLFSRIKRLPKKARSTRIVALDESPLPALITYFRQGKLDKFFRAQSDQPDAQELDFFQTAKILKPTDTEEKRQNIPADFYALLDKSKQAFTSVTAAEHEDAPSGRERRSERCLHLETPKGEGDFSLSWLHGRRRALHSAGQTTVNRWSSAPSDDQESCRSTEKVEPLKVFESCAGHSITFLSADSRTEAHTPLVRASDSSSYLVKSE